MIKRLFLLITTIGLAAAALVAFALPASAALRVFQVRLASGALVTVTVNAPADVPMSSVQGLPGTPVQELTPPPAAPATQAPPQQSTPQPPPQNPPPTGGGKGQNPSRHPNGSDGTPPSVQSPRSRHGGGQRRSGSRTPAKRPTSKKTHPQSKVKAPQHASGGGAPGAGVKPNFFDTLPGPGGAQSVPDVVLQNFQIPLFLIPMYQAAGIQYGVPWTTLAAINEIETNYGRDLSVSSAGAQGYMQFMPGTWKQYGVDANGDGKADPYDPVDAIFAAGRYLEAAGAQKNLRGAIFAYNHATWYVDSVQLRARALEAYPPAFVSSLTGLTEAHFPVAAPSRYSGQSSTKPAQPRLTQNATAVDPGTHPKRSVDIFSRAGAPVIAANDGVIKDMGQSKKLGKWIALQDVYGNQFRYSHLGSIAPAYAVPKQDVNPSKTQLATTAAARHRVDPQPSAPASAGLQPPTGGQAPARPPSPKARVAARPATRPPAPQPPTQAPTYKARAFAHPSRPNVQGVGGLEQLLNEQAPSAGQTAYDSYNSGVLKLGPKNSVLKPLKKGATVVAGTILGKIGPARGANLPHLRFEIRPAGKGAPNIDPAPVLDGWKLLAASKVYSHSGKNALYKRGRNFSVGQLLLLPKGQLERFVLSDPHIKIYDAGRRDVQTGQISRQVLFTLEYLVQNGMDPTVSSLKAGHSELTSSGNISEHTSGNAVDVSAINGTPILGNQQPGGITEQAVHLLMRLQGNYKPHQIITLRAFGDNTLALPDHANHIHVGYYARFGDNQALGQQTNSILGAKQWDTLIQRIGSLPNPVVPAKPSKAALPGTGRNGD